jgi:2-dehydro-3-deoxyglucarate aldolase
MPKLRPLSLGTWVTAAHPTIVELMAFQEFDWICLDLEHSPVSSLELQTSVAIIQGKNKKAFVRVAQNSHKDIKYPLDSGVDGIIIPMVLSFEEAKAALSYCRYPPVGTRGVGLARAQKFGFGFEDYIVKSRQLSVFCQIEHYRAVEDIERILSLDGLTGVFLGPYDLSGSLGVPGQFDHPEVKAAIQRVSEATISANKQLGIHVIEPSFLEVMKYLNIGYNFIAFSLDTLFLGRAVSKELTELKKHLGEG